ncbi:MAG: 4a-hydroxytetrahydrobiopterin dehydratase [Mariprofundaceae bacterium]
MKMKDKTCAPCRGGVPPLTKEAAQAMLADVSAWELNTEGTQLLRRFEFTDFAAAQAFAVKVGECADGENHHPVLTYSWGYCDVVFYTHKIGGLHENDFIMAAKVNALA